MLVKLPIVPNRHQGVTVKTDECWRVFSASLEHSTPPCHDCTNRQTAPSTEIEVARFDRGLWQLWPSTGMSVVYRPGKGKISTKQVWFRSGLQKLIRKSYSGPWTKYIASIIVLVSNVTFSICSSFSELALIVENVGATNVYPLFANDYYWVIGSSRSTTYIKCSV